MLNRNVVAQYSRDLSRDRHLDLFLQQADPMHHGPRFLSRRFINWFPLGMTYAFLYTGRYNLTIAKNAFGDLMSNDAFGLVFAAGTVLYAFSFN